LIWSLKHGVELTKHTQTKKVATKKIGEAFVNQPSTSCLGLIIMFNDLLIPTF
jgi:hypothetical protein